ncbi:MAG: S41 family peptidase [Chloroflexi bacterium]|nr:S41 family peptidase [Chloroflexota bacterium]
MQDSNSDIIKQPEHGLSPTNNPLDVNSTIPVLPSESSLSPAEVLPVRPKRRTIRNRLSYILGNMVLFVAAFFLGIIFTIYMTTHAFDNGIIKEIQKPILNASGIPADAQLQWLDLQAAFSNIDRFFYGRDKIDHKKMVWTAAEAAVHAVGDPFTLFRQPEQAQNDRQSLEARRLGGGLGFYPAIRDKRYLINRLIPGNSADKAGLQEGDVILKVDGQPVVLTGDDTKDIENTSKMVRGEIDSAVNLTIERPSENNRVFDVSVTRADIVVPPIITRLVGDNKDVGYINVTTFGPETMRLFDEKVGELEKSKVTSYVLDLRGNGGGLVDVSQKLLGRFLDGGVAYYRNVPYQNMLIQPENVINEKEGLKLYDKPLVVLIDGGTASASEITAGALQDRNRAALIGEKSFGKGMAQYVLDLPSKATVRITFEQWLTPNKTSLSETKGIQPNIAIESNGEDINAGRDTQLERALQFLKNKEALPPVPASSGQK